MKKMRQRLPVVPPLPDSTDGNEGVFRGPGLMVVRVVSEHVRRGVYQPCAMEHPAVAKRSCDPKGIPEVFFPHVLADERRKHEAHEEREPRV